MHVDTVTEMPEEFCDWTLRPDGVNLCTIACPGDCVLSGWSDWSICPKVSNFELLKSIVINPFTRKLLNINLPAISFLMTRMQNFF